MTSIKRTGLPPQPYVAPRPPPPPPRPVVDPRRSTDDVKIAPPPKAPVVLQPKDPAASTLLTEDIHDGERNCLDAAGDWLETRRTAGRDLSATEVIFLDERNEPSGHVLIRDGVGDAAPVIDPATGEQWDNLAAYRAQHPQYLNPRVVSGTAVMKVLDIPPEQRTVEATRAAGIPDSLATMEVADVVGAQSATLDVELASDEYSSAQGALAALDAQLAEDLASFGLNLSQDQINAYSTAFRASNDYTAAQTRLRAATDRLATTLAASGPVIEAALATPDGWTMYVPREAADALLNGYALLATSSRADDAIAFVRDLDARPGSPLRAFVAPTGTYDLVGQVLTPAMVNSGPMYLAANPGATPADAATHVTEQLEWLTTTRAMASGFADLIDPDSLAAARAALPLLPRIAAGDAAALRELISSSHPGTTTSALGGALAGVGLVFGVLGCADAMANDDGLRTAFYGAVTGQQGALVINSAITALNEAMHLALPGGALLTHAASALGGVACLVDIALQLQGPIDAGTLLSIGADAAGITSTLLFFAGSGAALPLAAGAAVVYLAGELISGLIQGNITSERRNRIATAAGIDPSTFIPYDTETTQQLMQLGLTREQIRTLAAGDPSMVESNHGWGPSLGGLIALQQRTGLTGQQLFDMLVASNQGLPAGQGTAQLMGVLGTSYFPEIMAATSIADLAARLEARAAESDGEQATALRNAAAWLRANG